ncbi:MAG: class I SAM-dependent methyltransferase [Proteobacteria bacterium]|nr:class I SAM-dependent methyltransferase [Pseudomonadota bacterium]
MTDLLKKKTISDFGDQWNNFQKNEGYYGSSELFQDLFSSLIPPSELKDLRVADIGSGTGRIVNMLLDVGCRHVVAIEPSNAFNVLKKNVANRQDRVTCLNVTGENIPFEDLDFIFSAGVLHHIPEPRPVVDAAFQALRPGGKIAVWLYGKEGNRLYLAVFQPLRMLTTKLPHYFLVALCWIMYPILFAYISACKIIPLPMKNYMLSHLDRLSVSNQILTIYDQLNPAYAKYYSRQEVVALLEESGFADIKLYHRHGYSWSATGIKPKQP